MAMRVCILILALMSRFIDFAGRSGVHRIALYAFILLWALQIGLPLTTILGIVCFLFGMYEAAIYQRLSNVMIRKGRTLLMAVADRSRYTRIGYTQNTRKVLELFREELIEGFLAAARLGIHLSFTTHQWICDHVLSDERITAAYTVAVKPMGKQSWLLFALATIQLLSWQEIFFPSPKVMERLTRRRELLHVTLLPRCPDASGPTEAA